MPEPVKRNLENDVIKGMLRRGSRSMDIAPEYVKDVGTVDRVNQTLADIERGVDCGKMSQKQTELYLYGPGRHDQPV